ncbi:MAG: isopentenyl-diphosphate delta-isomerase [Micrococcaceae bacterium]|nr:isopentenyl-diphosphate delta-isomerase [Micrococcaceae bacterium]
MTLPPEEQVVLLDDQRRPIGSADKATVHGLNTPLHLAFSCHIFNPEGQVLVTRRALGKAAWPGVWTNSVCGHPAPGEEVEAAVHRRVRYELGLQVMDVQLRLPDFQYRAVDASGIVEHEVCPVYTAVTRDAPQPRPEEVMDYQWVRPPDVRMAIEAAPWAFSPWLVLQLGALGGEWTTEP